MPPQARGYFQERFLDCVLRRAHTARKKKAQDSAQNDGALVQRRTRFS